MDAAERRVNKPGVPEMPSLAPALARARVDLGRAAERRLHTVRDPVGLVTAAGSAGTAGRDYRIPPKAGRHRAPIEQYAHGPNDLCPTCRDCTSCEGGTARIPAYFRVIQHATPHAGIALRAQCTDCDGTGTSCLNIAQRQESA